MLDDRPDHWTSSNQTTAAKSEPISIADKQTHTRSHAAAVTRRLYEEVWNAGRYEVAEVLFHRDFAYPAAPDLRGPEAKLVAIGRYRASCPDLHIHIDDLIVDQDKVAVRWTRTGTDTGGLAGRPPTGRAITTWGVDILGFQDGQIISDWIGADWLSLFIQVGVIADPWPH
jgi:predicted ester cyclase